MQQLFVYGSLRSGFHSPAYEYISRYFTLVGKATVKGKLFDLGSYPAGIKTDDNTFIVGELYKITNPEEFGWAIGQLDDYEGVNGEQDERPLYQRELTEVHLDNTLTQAWIYWYTGDTTGKPYIESGDMIEYMKKRTAL